MATAPIPTPEPRDSAREAPRERSSPNAAGSEELAPSQWLATAGMRRARHEVASALAADTGPIVVRGPAGHGKTLLLRSLRASPPSGFAPLFVPQDVVEPGAPSDRSRNPHVPRPSARLARLLHLQALRGALPVLLLDDLQELSPARLAALLQVITASRVDVRMVMAGREGERLRVVLSALPTSAPTIVLDDPWSRADAELMVAQWAAAQGVDPDELVASVAVDRALAAGSGNPRRVRAALLAALREAAVRAAKAPVPAAPLSAPFRGVASEASAREASARRDVASVDAPEVMRTQRVTDQRVTDLRVAGQRVTDERVTDRRSKAPPTPDTSTRARREIVASPEATPTAAATHPAPPTVPATVATRRVGPTPRARVRRARSVVPAARALLAGIARLARALLAGIARLAWALATGIAAAGRALVAVAARAGTRTASALFAASRSIGALLVAARGSLAAAIARTRDASLARLEATRRWATRLASGLARRCGVAGIRISRAVVAGASRFAQQALDTAVATARRVPARTRVLPLRGAILRGAIAGTGALAACAVLGVAIARTPTPSITSPPTSGPPAEAGTEPAVAAAPTASVEATLLAAPVAAGPEGLSHEAVAFRVNSHPWASVEVDGVEAGSTPFTISLEPGEHRFRVAMSDGRVLDEVLVVSAERNHAAFR